MDDVEAWWGAVLVKEILKEVISRLDSTKSKYCRIKHKQGGKEFLDDGDLVVNPVNPKDPDIVRAGLFS